MRVTPWVLPWVCSGWLVGVLIGSLTLVPPLVARGASVVVLLGYVVWEVGLRRASGKPRRARLFVWALLAGLVGLSRANGALLADAATRSVWGPLYGRPAEIRGIVREVSPRGTTDQLTVGQLEVLGRSLPGLLRVTTWRDAELHEGARVRLRGRVRRPEDLTSRGVVSRGDLERVFARRGIVAALQFPRLVVDARGHPSHLARVRWRMRATILRNLPEPAAGLYSALLLSFDHDLSYVVRERVAATGLLHLLAISGSHLAVIATIAVFGLGALGVPRLAATSGTLILVGAFVALVGFPESGVRSAIMTGCVLGALLLGREAGGLRALLLAVTVMTAVNPRILLGDVGFELSALAVWGLLVIAPALDVRLRALPNPVGIRSLFVLTLAAELATLPVVMYAFGRIPLVGPFTNLLAGYLFPALLVTGSALVGVGLLAPALVTWVSPLAAALASTFLGLADVASRLPWHAVTLPPISLGAYIGSVVLLLVAGHSVPRRVRRAGVW